MTERTLTEREAFVATWYFIEQFNEREKSDALAMWIDWVRVGDWDDPLMTNDPAQWHDWVKCVERVVAERAA
jgi:hypothetical protein